MTAPSELYQHIETALLTARDSEHLRRIADQKKADIGQLPAIEQRWLREVYKVKRSAMLHFRGQS